MTRPTPTVSARVLHVVGAGGHARAVGDVAEECGFSIAPVPDSWPQQRGSSFDIAPKSLVIVAIGNNAKRLALVKRLMEEGYELPVIVHPTAAVSKKARLGAGSVVMPQAAITAGVTAGVGTIVNTSASVDHDCVLADGVHISPGAHLAGGVIVGEESWIGLGAVVREGIRIGARAVVGAGAAVVSDVPEQAQVAGVPAKAL
mgnify:CR=1 FL=1